MERKRLLIGMTGASGAPLAVELLRQLRAEHTIESHVIVSKCGYLTLQHEMGMGRSEIEPLCTKLYDNEDYDAGPASGSFRTMGMVVIPCSMKTLAGVVTGYCDTLLLRAADVTMKERRRLVLVPRECPFSTVHLRNLTAASELGAVIVPPVPAYYEHPQSIDDVNRRVVQKVLTLFGLEQLHEWTGAAP